MVLSSCLTRLCACCLQVPFNDTAFALIRRGPASPDNNCSFGLKVFHAQMAGFAGAIIYDYESDAPLVMMEYDGPLNINISSVFVSSDAGARIKLWVEDAEIDGIAIWATMYPDVLVRPFLFTFVTIVAGISIVFTLFLVSWPPASLASVSFIARGERYSSRDCFYTVLSLAHCRRSQHNFCFVWLPHRQETLHIVMTSFRTSRHSRFHSIFFSLLADTPCCVHVFFLKKSFIDGTRWSSSRDQRCGCHPHRLSSWRSGLLSRATKTKHAVSASSHTLRVTPSPLCAASMSSTTTASSHGCKSSSACARSANGIPSVPTSPCRSVHRCCRLRPPLRLTRVMSSWVVQSPPPRAASTRLNAPRRRVMSLPQQRALLPTPMPRQTLLLAPRSPHPTITSRNRLPTTTPRSMGSSHLSPRIAARAVCEPSVISTCVALSLSQYARAYNASFAPQPDFFY